MNIKIRKSNQRGAFKNEWLNAKHTFSFGSYYDPANMGFGPLRVINQDIISAGKGFGMHGHDNMEIITFVTHGRLRHKDTLGSEATISPGEIQMMSAGTGIRHSEFNDLLDQDLKLLQIWIEPNTPNLKPRYQDLQMKQIQKTNGFLPLATEKGQRGGLRIDADADLYLFDSVMASENLSENSLEKTNEKTTFKSNRAGHVFIQVISGSVMGLVESEKFELSAGDSAALEILTTSVGGLSELEFRVSAETQFILFDLGVLVF